MRAKIIEINNSSVTIREVDSLCDLDKLIGKDESYVIVVPLNEGKKSNKSSVSITDNSVSITYPSEV